ncbi:DUF4236 domain-containing protein [Polynucleobacter sp. P1-05-14]|nr:DUF4236 domain-containing protein [Polynucleobacter sp. P1-05-14]MBU3549475.1 DUF4236 domain-containing protein [Polynucleobacter sp. P1-05-14]
MGLRLQKRITLFKGLSLNLSKTGASISVGTRGARLNIRGDKVTGSVGLPGTGISYRQRLDNLGSTEQAQQLEPIQDLHAVSDSVTEQEDRELTWKLLALLFFIGFAVVTALYLTK